MTDQTPATVAGRALLDNTWLVTPYGEANAAVCRAILAIEAEARALDAEQLDEITRSNDEAHRALRETAQRAVTAERQLAEARALDRDALAEAVKVALSVALHEYLDPKCSGSPPYHETQAIADTVMRTPNVRAALAPEASE